MKEYITNKLDILIARLMIWRIKVGYGEKCETKDTDDFPEHKGQPRCPTCEANEIRDWLEDFIKLVKGI